MERYLLFEEFIEEKKKKKKKPQKPKNKKPKKNTAEKMKDVDKKIKKIVKKAKKSQKEVKSQQDEIKDKPGKTTPQDKMRGALSKVQTQKHRTDIDKQLIKKKELAIKSKIDTLKKKEKAQKELEDE
tara:strand:+ start:2741 stop:3121 length:381 start_codon:yes stop_codon:yes gene_type:complete